MDGARALFRKNNTGLDGNIKTEEIGSFMNAAGLGPTPGEVLNAHRVLDPIDTGFVAFSDLENWLSEQCVVQKRSQYNRLLVKPLVGKGKRPTYDVPGAAHTYGTRVTRDEVTGKDLLFNWKVAQPSKATDAYVDRVKMNREAAKKGLTSAKAFVTHSQTERIYTYNREKPRPKPAVDTTQAFGQKPYKSRQIVQPSMQDLITAKYNHSMFDEEKEYPEPVKAAPAGKNAAVSVAAPFSTDLPSTTTKPSKNYRHTKASKMQADRAQQLKQPVEKKVFTLKQFRNIQPRVQTRRTTGSNIVSDPGY